MSEARALIDEHCTEKEFLAQVTAYAKVHHWMVYHTHRSDRSEAGYPDCTFVRPASYPVTGHREPYHDHHVMANDPRLIFAELKVGHNRPTAAQMDWILALRDAGQPVFIWYPSDWRSVEEVLGGE